MPLSLAEHQGTLKRQPLKKIRTPKAERRSSRTQAVGDRLRTQYEELKRKNLQLSLELSLLRAQSERASANYRMRDERLINSLSQAHIHIASIATVLRGLLTDQSSRLVQQTGLVKDSGGKTL